MSPPRFFAVALPASGEFELDENESRHALRVLRMAVGDTCLVFDGCGGEARCDVKSMSQRTVKLEVVARLDVDRELPVPLHVLVALPKGDRQKTLLDFLVQLGAHSLQPLITKRSVAQPVEAALVRLRRGVIEFSKQCGRNRLLIVMEPIEISQLYKPARQASSGVNAMRLFAHPYGEVSFLQSQQPLVAVAPSIDLLIGPEGGLTEEEAGGLRLGGWSAVSLGPRILRVEVAATYAVSWLAETVNASDGRRAGPSPSS